MEQSSILSAKLDCPVANGAVFYSVCQAWLSSGPPECFTFSDCAWSWNWSGFGLVDWFLKLIFLIPILTPVKHLCFNLNVDLAFLIWLKDNMGSVVHSCEHIICYCVLHRWTWFGCSGWLCCNRRAGLGMYWNSDSCRSKFSGCKYEKWAVMGLFLAFIYPPVINFWSSYCWTFKSDCKNGYCT